MHSFSNLWKNHLQIHIMYVLTLIYKLIANQFLRLKALADLQKILCALNIFKFNI